MKLSNVVKSYKIVKLTGTSFFIKDGEFIIDSVGDFTGSLTRNFQVAKIFTEKDLIKNNFMESVEFEVVDVKLVLQ